MQSNVNVLVVDDHPLYRQGVVHCFKSSGNFDVVGEGACAKDAIELVADRKPDILLLDLHLPGGGLEAAEAILAVPGGPKIIILSFDDNIDCVIRAFRMGVSGYLLKGVGGCELIKFVEAAVAGEHCVAPQLLGRLLDHLSGKRSPLDERVLVRFGAREEQILTLLSHGMSNKEIAFKLSICEKTTKYYLTNIMKKLNAKNRVEVALFASQRSFKRGDVSY